MKEKLFVERLYFFNDQRVRYTAEHIRSLVEDGVTAPDTPVHIVEVAFKASDILEYVAPLVRDRALPEIDEVAITANCLNGG